MPKKLITITKPDGTKKVVVLKENNKEPIKTNNSTPIKTNTQSIKVRNIDESNNKNVITILPVEEIVDTSSDR